MIRLSHEWNNYLAAIRAETKLPHKLEVRDLQLASLIRGISLESKRQ